jgi:hypothetical protein
MYWNTLIVLGIYMSLQLLMGILTLIFTDQPGSRKTDVGTPGGDNVIPTDRVDLSAAGTSSASDRCRISAETPPRKTGTLETDFLPTARRPSLSGFQISSPSSLPRGSGCDLGRRGL